MWVKNVSKSIATIIGIVTGINIAMEADMCCEGSDVFVRVKTVRGRSCLQVVENYREGGKVRQRVISTLGRPDKLKRERDR